MLTLRRDCLLQNASVEGQVSKLRLCYARERSAPTGAAADALEVRRPLPVAGEPADAP